MTLARARVRGSPGLAADAYGTLSRAEPDGRGAEFFGHFPRGFPYRWNESDPPIISVGPRAPLSFLGRTVDPTVPANRSARRAMTGGPYHVGRGAGRHFVGFSGKPCPGTFTL